MTTLQFKRPQVTWRRLLLAAAGAGAVGAAVWLARTATVSEAGAAPATTATAPATPPVSTEPSDYGRRVVAYVYGNTPVTREQLGEYLIARLGPDRVLNLVNKLIIERTCADRGVTVTDAEVDVALAEEVDSFKINRREFIDKVLREYHKSLYEWKEDVLRPKLLLTKMLRNDVRVNEADVRNAFESMSGERVYCQAIMWPLAREAELKEKYEALIKDPVEFTRVARTQNRKAILSVGGLLEPFGHHSLDDPEVEKVIFSLKEGEITPVIRAKMPDGEFCAIVKLLKKFPPDTTRKLEDVRPAIEKEIIEAEVRASIPDVMVRVQKAADPTIVLKPILAEDDWDRKVKRAEAPAADGVPAAQQPVAFIYGTTPVTREQLGEYLIARYGAERLDLMVNKMIVEKECAARGLTVSEAEIDEALAKDVSTAQAKDKTDFIQNHLRANRTNLYGYREDVLRPKLLLARLARANVKVEEDDLRKAFEAYHGEKAECQIILWPRTPRDHEIAIKQYGQFRQGPDEFDRAARTQASARLAAKAGRVAPFARHTSGSEDLEREVFALRPGDLTPVVETPDGYVVARLIRKLPPTGKPADPEAARAERAGWEAEIVEKKTQLQIPAEFAKLRAAAAPNLLLRTALKEEDWIREVKQEISGLTPEASHGGR